MPYCIIFKSLMSGEANNSATQSEIIAKENFKFFIAEKSVFFFERPGLRGNIRMHRNFDIADLLAKGKVKIAPEGIIFFTHPLISARIAMGSRALLGKHLIAQEICSKYGAHSVELEALFVNSSTFVWYYSFGGFPEAHLPVAVLNPSAPTVHEITEGPGDIVFTEGTLVEPAANIPPSLQTISPPAGAPAATGEDARADETL